MLRLRALALVLPFVVLGCGGGGSSTTSDCDSVEDFDLSDCDVPSLAQLEHEGTWNMLVTPGNGTPFDGHFSLLEGTQQLDGATITGSVLDESNFVLQTRLTANVDGSAQLVERTFLACRAKDPKHFEGKQRVCVGGSLVDEGRFDAARVAPIAGEPVASGLTLVSEFVGANGELRTNGTPVAVTTLTTADKKYAYVARSYSSGQIAIVDVTVPEAPVFVRSLTPQTSDSYGDVLVKNNVLYVASAASGLVYFDLANPTVPVRLGNRPSTSLVSVTKLVEDPENPNLLYAVAPTPTAQVLVFDVSKPLDPVELGRATATGAAVAGQKLPVGAVALHQRLYVSHAALGLVIFDVSNPASPTQLGQLSDGNVASASGAVGDIGGKVVFFEGEHRWGGHLRAIDVTDPAAPVVLGEFRLRDEVAIDELVLRGTQLYATWFQDGVRVFDVSDPANLVPVAHHQTWRESDPGRGASFFEGANSIRVPGDGLIYVTESSRGLMIFRQP